MIDTTKEQVFPLATLRVTIKRRNGVSRSWHTWYRWCDRNHPHGGTLNKFTGERVYLEFLYLGGVAHSSVEAFDRFWAKQNEGRE